MLALASPSFSPMGCNSGSGPGMEAWVGVEELPDQLAGLDDLDGLAGCDAVRIIWPRWHVAGWAAGRSGGGSGSVRGRGRSGAGRWVPGLRARADVTDLVRTAGQQDSVACDEFLLERYAARHPLPTLCMYCSAVGGALTQFVCMHAALPAGLAPFQVYARGDGAVAFSGRLTRRAWPGLRRRWGGPGRCPVAVALCSIFRRRGSWTIGPLGSRRVCAKVPGPSRLPGAAAAGRRIAGRAGLGRLFSDIGVV
jgi:hypothetical protein